MFDLDYLPSNRMMQPSDGVSFSCRSPRSPSTALIAQTRGRKGHPNAGGACLSTLTYLSTKRNQKLLKYKVHTQAASATTNIRNLSSVPVHITCGFCVLYRCLRRSTAMDGNLHISRNSCLHPADHVAIFQMLSSTRRIIRNSRWIGQLVE